MNEAIRVKLIVFSFSLVFIVIGVYVYFALDDRPQGPGEEATIEEVTPPMPAEVPAGPEHPEMEERPSVPVEPEPTDEQIRKRAGALSPDPELSRWLLTRHLLGKFTAVVENVANGRSPRKLLPFLAPGGRFEVFEKNGREYMDPKSYRRYDRLVEAFTSLDASGCARLLMRLEPSLNRSYRELGVPGRNFRAALNKAMAELLRVPVVEGDIPLERIEVTLKIARGELESMSDAQKHLFRMGPVNVRKVQAKLREIGRALGISMK